MGTVGEKNLRTRDHVIYKMKGQGITLGQAQFGKVPIGSTEGPLNETRER